MSNILHSLSNKPNTVCQTHTLNVEISVMVLLIIFHHLYTNVSSECVFPWVGQCGPV